MSAPAPKKFTSGGKSFTMRGKVRPPPPGKTTTLTAESEAMYRLGDEPETNEAGELITEAGAEDAEAKRKLDKKRRNKLRKNQAKGLEVVAVAPSVTSDLSKHYLLRGDDDDASQTDAQQHRDRLAAEAAAKEARSTAGRAALSNRQKRQLAFDLRKQGKPVPPELELTRAAPAAPADAAAAAAAASVAAAAGSAGVTSGKGKKRSAAAAAAAAAADDIEVVAESEADDDADAKGSELSPVNKKAAPAVGKRGKKLKGPADKSAFLKSENRALLSILGAMASKQEAWEAGAVGKLHAKAEWEEAKKQKRAADKAKRAAATQKAMTTVRAAEKEKKEMKKLLAESDDDEE
jgi:hypothetical protein